MPCKINLFFQDKFGGWSETYYNLTDDPVAFIKQIAGPAANAGGQYYLWAANRLQMLAPDYSLVGIRASKIGDFRNSFEADLDATLWGAGRYPTTRSSETFASLLIQLASAGPPVQRRNLFLGGIPETIIGGFQDYVTNSIWRNRLNGFGDSLKSAGFCLNVRPSKLLPNNVLLTQFTISADGKSVTVLPSPAGLVVGIPQQAIIRGMKNPRGWNGQHRILLQPPVPPAMTGNTVIGPVKKPGVSIPAWDPTQSGFIQLAADTNPLITEVNAKRIVERKRGRFFEQQRGRR